MKGPIYQDRIERNYQVGVSEDGVAGLWRELSECLPKYGLHAMYQITCVGSVYFDNRDCDLTRYTVVNGGRHILVRLRTYENYGESPKPISDYWVEVKIREKERWRKKRFRLNRADLAEFLEGRDAGRNVWDYSENGVDPEVVRNLYRETQETVLTTGLKPILLLTYKRLAFQNEIERLCLDWDIQYYHVGTDVYSYDSWKYPVEEPAGKSDKTILEFKYPRGSPPAWIADVEKRYPIQETGFLKFVEGMGFLFQGPLKSHRESDSFLQLIEAYGGESRPLGVGC